MGRRGAVVAFSLLVGAAAATSLRGRADDGSDRPARSRGRTTAVAGNGVPAGGGSERVEERPLGFRARAAPARGTDSVRRAASRLDVLVSDLEAAGAGDAAARVALGRSTLEGRQAGPPASRSGR